MKAIKTVLYVSLAGTVLLWLCSDSLWVQPFEFFAFRFKFNQLSGTLAMMAMSLCMILATRPKKLAQGLNGLDKGYRLHKWLGIAALVMAVLHFLMAHGTKWLVQLGWLTRHRGGRPQRAADQPMDFEHWLGSFRGIAENVGEWVFYVVVVLLMMALVKRIPYRTFVKWHKWLAVCYLGLVFHTVVLFKFSYWAQPIGIVMGLLLIGGTLSAVRILLNRVGRKQQYAARVCECRRLSDDLTEVLLDAPTWRGHQAGQFVFVRHWHDREKAHPFSLAASWQPTEKRLRLLVKALGDYTATGVPAWKRGDPICVEGAYGCFTMDDHQPQIWIATGIGITPFLARLETLENGHPPIDCFVSYRALPAVLLDELRAKAEKAGVSLHLICTATQPRLNADDIKRTVTDYAARSVWCCGSEPFAATLKAALAVNAFHHELFEMR